MRACVIARFFFGRACRTLLGIGTRRGFQLTDATYRWCVRACWAHRVSFCVISIAAAKSCLIVTIGRTRVASARAFAPSMASIAVSSSVTVAAASATKVAGAGGGAAA